MASMFGGVTTPPVAAGTTPAVKPTAMPTNQAKMAAAAKPGLQSAVARTAMAKPAMNQARTAMAAAARPGLQSAVARKAVAPAATAAATPRVQGTGGAGFARPVVTGNRKPTAPAKVTPTKAATKPKAKKASAPTSKGFYYKDANGNQMLRQPNGVARRVTSQNTLQKLSTQRAY